MSDFLQVHLLTAYGPSNLNRDDQGRPKSVTFGGVPRLRISSQSLKRAWRTSQVFAERLDGHLGSRTRRLGDEVYQQLTAGGLDDAAALAAARQIAALFGKLKKSEDGAPARSEALAFISPDERGKVQSLVDRVLAGGTLEGLAPSDVLQAADTAADVAMFGRMLAAQPRYNRDAAVQVSHAMTVHRAAIEEDYYTAVDDLAAAGEDAAAGFLGTQEFGAGVFYLYLCIDRGLLLRNLQDEHAVRDAAIAALLEAACTIAPGGKQASFASRALAFYGTAERGTQQPRSLAPAFLAPIGGENHGHVAIEALEDHLARLDATYGARADERCSMNSLASNGAEGSLEELIGFATE